MEMGVLTEEENEKLRRNAVTAVEEAVKFAMESPFPEPEEALEDVYVEEESASKK